MDIARTSDAWWKNAIFYCLDVETFQDGNGDGIGDFVGLAQRIDYLAGLGVTCLWLMPFYPSPNRDDGYDITDYYAIDQRLGSMGDFVEFLRTARDRGIRVIVDLVVNHTSREHPWFRSARSDRNSPYRDWYVWRDEVPETGPEGLVFSGQGGKQLGVGRGSEGVLSAPLLRASAGSQHRQSGGARRNPEDRRVDTARGRPPIDAVGD